MIRNIILYSLILFVGFTSCSKKDFSVNGDYEDVTIVYALLNPDDTVHYIEIYKSFLTEGNAYDAAKDINNYSYIDSIEVTLEEYHNEVLLRTVTFDTTTSIPKDSGVFASPLQVLYTGKIDLNRNYTYKIVVRNKYSQKITTATTPLVGTLTLGYPLYYVNRRNSITFLPRQQRLEYAVGLNIALCQASYYYYYTEVYKNGERKQCSPIIWNLGESKIQYLTYYGETLFSKIKDGVKENEEVYYRLTDSVVLHINSVANDYYLYMLTISASTGLNQERLEYTNMKSYEWKDGVLEENKNALGVFSSRGMHSWKFEELSDMSNDSLLYGRYTRHLKFRDYDY